MPLSRFFAVPAFSAALALFLIAVAAKGAPQSWLVLAVATLGAAAIGAGAGYASARHTTVRVALAAARPRGASTAAYDVYTRGSYVTLAIWAGALAIRQVTHLLAPHDLASTTIANAAVVTLLATSICVARVRTFLVARAAITSGSGATVDAA